MLTRSWLHPRQTLGRDLLDEDSPKWLFSTISHWLKQSIWLRITRSGGCCLRTLLVVQVRNDDDDDDDDSVTVVNHVTYLVSPRTICLHFWTLETFGGNYGGERGSRWKLFHVDTLSKVNELEAAVRSLEYWSNVLSITHWRSSTNTNYQCQCTRHNTLNTLSIFLSTNA